MGVERLELSRPYKSTDFKSGVSTIPPYPLCLGDTQIRTGDRGFAIHCLTTWPYRHIQVPNQH